MLVCPNLQPETVNASWSSATTLAPQSRLVPNPGVTLLKEQIDTLKFVAYGVLSFVIISLGIVGNVINLVVLTRPNLKGITFVYLTWLATSDLLTLVVAVFSMLRLHGIQPRTYPVALYFAHIEMPLVNALMASSVFLVVAVTVDRYWSVCLPTRYLEFHNARRAKLSIVAAYVAAALLYVPVAFQKAPVPVWDSQENITQYVPCDSVSVSQHPAFKIYLLVKEVLVRIGPVLVVAVLNTTIIITFRKLMRKRKQLTNSSSSRDSGKFLEEQRLVMLLAAIVIMFCVCMTPAAVLTVLISDDKELNYGFQLFRAIANDMEMANFAMNFYVYCFCSMDFRETFLKTFRFKRTAPDITYVMNPKSDSSCFKWLRKNYKRDISTL